MTSLTDILNRIAMNSHDIKWRDTEVLPTSCTMKTSEKHPRFVKLCKSVKGITIGSLLYNAQRDDLRLVTRARRNRLYTKKDQGGKTSSRWRKDDILFILYPVKPCALHNNNLED